MLKRFEILFTDWIRRRPKGVLSSFARLILFLISLSYGFVVRFRSALFRQGWIPAYSSPVPIVISVGNIVAGGSGKTPITIKLAKELLPVAPLAILSRGYRSQAENGSEPMVVSRGSGPCKSALSCGDEAYLLAKRIPGAFVISGRNRHKASNLAAREGIKIILLDDGMQHRALSRDFEVVVLDAEDPFGQGYFLPRGFLREDVGELSRADLVVLNHAESDERFWALSQELKQFTKAPVVRAKAVIEGVVDFDGRAVIIPNGSSVAAFCAIANPGKFFKSLNDLNLRIVDTLAYSDHMPFQREALVEFAAKAKSLGAEALICTEKDRVKFDEPLDLGLPLYTTEMHLRFMEGEEGWEAFVVEVQKARIENLTIEILKSGNDPIEPIYLPGGHHRL